eukprot:g7399.t1
MFHAVNQMTGEELGSPGTGTLPMFRERNPSGRTDSRNGPSRRTHQAGGAGSGSGPTGISGSMTPSDATAGGAGGAPTGALEMRPIHHAAGGGGAAARRRRSGQLKDITGGRAVVTTTSSPNTTAKHPAAAFAGPDGVDTAGFADAGTFRWDATVADTATAQQDEQGEDGMEQEEGGGGSGGRRNSSSGRRGLGGGRRGGSGMRRSKVALSPPLSDDMADIALAPRYRKPWFIITPESRIHQILDHLGDLLTLYVVVAIPLFVSFQHIENMHAEDWHAFNFIVDVCFLVDLAGRFLTAYHDEYADRMVYDPMRIVRQYSRGLLVFDLIASFPLTIMLGVNTFSISNKVTRLARMPQTMRLIRSIKLLSEEAEKTNRKNILLATYNLVKVCLYILLVMHWVACGWHLLADLEDADLSWIVKDGLEDAPASNLYVTSVYWTVTTLSTVGYGDIFASTIAERTYCILVMLTGATMYALAIGAVSHIITTVVARHSHSRRIEGHAEAFIRMHALPQHLASEIMRTLNISGETDKMLEKRAQNTLELLPPGIRTSTLLCIYRSQIARIPFFRNRKDTYPVFVTSVVRSMHDHIYPKAGETVLVEDGNAEEVIFVVRGRASITRRGVEVGRLSAGSCFGAMAALYAGGLRRESVTCVTDCEMYTIEGAALRRISRSFPVPMSELKAESERPLFACRERTGASGDTPAPPPANIRARRSDSSSGASSRELMAVARDGAGENGGHTMGSPQRTVVMHAAGQSGVFGDPGSSIQTASELQRSVRTLETCLAEASQMEAEVWDRLQLLTDSQRALRHCLYEGREAHKQVMDLARREELPRALDGADDSRLVDAGLLPPGRDASAHGSSSLSRGVS